MLTFNGSLMWIPKRNVEDIVISKMFQKIANSIISKFETYRSIVISKMF